MNGKLLAQSLLQAKGDELRLVYALLVETKMLQLLTSRVKDTFNKDVNHLEQDLETIIEQLQQVSDQELQLKLFLHMLEQLGIRGAHFNVYAEIEHACTQIVEKAYALQIKQDKEFAAFTHGREEEEALQLVMYQMQKIFADFNTKLDELSEAETEQFVEKIENYIQSLPSEKQRQIKEKLDIDELTAKTLRQLMVSQGTVLVMTIVVEVAGFAAFTALTSFMASAAGLIGLTLPFGAYLFATSALSILTGPIGIGLALLGGGALMKYQSDKLRRTLIPIGIVQLVLPVVIEGEKPVVHASQFIDQWLPLYEKQQQLLHTLTDYNERNERLYEQKQQVIEAIEQKQQQIASKTNEINKVYAEINAAINDVPKSYYNERALEIEQQINEKREQIAQNLTEIQGNSEQKGFFNAIKSTFANHQISNQLSINQRDCEQLQRILVEELLAVNSPQLAENGSILGLYQKVVANLIEEKAELEQQNQNLIKAMDDNRMIIKVTTKQLKDHQKQHYGLAHIE